ncbi:UbiD family decarboxylase [Paraburkholderia sp. GAS41]
MSNSSPCLNFRSFIDELRRRNDLVEIAQPVDANPEIGAIPRKVYEDRAPAPLFQSIRGVEPGFRVLGAPAGLNRQKGEEFGRLALHFGLPKSARPKEILERIISASGSSPIAPQIVDSGPCKENIWRGNEVDLTRFLVPLLHAADGGRYFGIYGFHVVRSPDGSWDSGSVARSMLHDKNTLVGPAMPQQHIGMIHGMWKSQGTPTPWAMVLGAPPAALAVAGMPLPERVSEGGYVGAMTGEAVEVVRTETNDLLVPANAEIILEGTISLSERAMEGPIGEYHGYSFAVGREQPLFHVEAVTFRHDPILLPK